MTISMFDAYAIRMTAVRAMRMMDIGQATAYGQATADGRRSIWNAWTMAVTRATQLVSTIYSNIQQGSKSVITWNGESMDKEGLRRMFRSIFGRRSVE